MYKFLLAIAVAGLLAGITGGCRSSRSAKSIRKVMATPSNHPDTTVVTQTPLEPARDLKADSLALIQSTVEQLEKNHIDFQTFSARTKVHYQGSDGKDYELNALIHMQKDKMIWISVTATLGIEAVRMLITPDSVKVLDKIKKVARLRSVSYLQDEVHLPVDFQTLQDLLIGNPIFLDTARILYYKKEQAGLSLFSSGNVFTNYLTLNADNTLRHSKLDDTDPLRVRTCDMTYGDYEQRDTIRFSTYRKVSVAEKAKVDIEFSYKQFKFNEPLSFSFSIPKNYKRH
jgi:hypothetical protein